VKVGIVPMAPATPLWAAVAASDAEDTLSLSNGRRAHSRLRSGLVVITSVDKDRVDELESAQHRHDCDSRVPPR